MVDYETMTGSELGRQLAPDTIKDKEGWGRKTLRMARRLGDTVTEGLKNMGVLQRTQADVHLDALMSLGGHDPHQYKAPHALRGTPPRPHFKRR